MPYPHDYYGPMDPYGPRQDTTAFDQDNGELLRDVVVLLSLCVLGIALLLATGAVRLA